MSKPSLQPFAASPWLVLTVVGAGIAAAALGARDLPDWRAVQDDYQSLAPEFEPELRAAPIGPVADVPVDGREYCSSCHIAGAGYAAFEGQPFGAHPEVGHDPLELGCTPCHRGDPGSLAFHDEPAFGRDTPMSGAWSWMSCLQCHDARLEPELMAPYPRAVALQTQLHDLMERHGCLACHTMGGRGGLVGPELAAFGATPVSDPTAVYEGRRIQARMQLEDPLVLQPASKMPTMELDPIEREALAVWLSLQGHVDAHNHGAWDPGAPASVDCSGKTYHWFCEPCHANDGSGRERGRAPGAVPALASPLWLTYTSEDFVRHTIAEGRDGSLMEAFRSEDGQPIITEDELDALVDHVLTANLVWEPDQQTYDRVAAASCEACHTERSDYLEGRDDAARAAYLAEHPWRWSVDDWLADEGLVIDSCEVQDQDEEGQVVLVHAGEQLYEDLCVHCHEDPERGPLGDEPSAPALRGFFEHEHHDAGYLLASVVIGRPDAPPTKWRHQGVTAGEYTPQQLACLARWLEDTP